MIVKLRGQLVLYVKEPIFSPPLEVDQSVCVR